MTLAKTAVTRLLLTLVVICFTVSLTQASSLAAGPGGAAPNFELSDLNGAKIALSGFKDKKPVLVYFWATWCPYCLAVRPEVIKMRKAIPENDLAILAVNVGGGDSLARLKSFEEKNPAPYTVLYDGEGKSARSFGVLGIPHFILIDKNGTIRYSSNELPPDPLAMLK